MCAFLLRFRIPEYPVGPASTKAKTRLPCSGSLPAALGRRGIRPKSGRQAEVPNRFCPKTIHKRLARAQPIFVGVPSDALRWRAQPLRRHRAAADRNAPDRCLAPTNPDFPQATSSCASCRKVFQTGNRPTTARFRAGVHRSASATLSTRLRSALRCHKKGSVRTTANLGLRSPHNTSSVFRRAKARQILPAGHRRTAEDTRQFPKWNTRSSAEIEVFSARAEGLETVGNRLLECRRRAHAPPRNQPPKASFHARLPSQLFQSIFDHMP